MESFAADNILAQMKAVSSAEDIFRLLDVDYDPKVMNASRLHILKRMGDYLASENLADIPDSIAATRCKASSNAPTKIL